MAQIKRSSKELDTSPGFVDLHRNGEPQIHKMSSNTLSVSITQFALAVSLVVAVISVYEAGRGLVKKSHGTRSRKIPGVKELVEDDDDDSSEDNMSTDESVTHELVLGPDCRPTSGLKREGLVVRDTRMSDTEINLHLSILLDHLKERTKHHLGYPYNLSFRGDNLVPFLSYSINNLGDPFVASNYGVHSRDFEIAVLDFFANIYRISRDEFWGYVTCSGTEGNLLGILYGREKFLPKRDAVLYFSKDTHYSIPKSAKMYQMEYEVVDSDPTGEMMYTDLEKKISKHLDRPIIVNVNAGTTVKGASDTVDEVIAVLEKLKIPRSRYYIHVDGALSGVILPFVSTRCENKRISFEKSIDSVSVSGHKMLGTPMPSGIVITRKEHSERFSSNVEYLNSNDTTIMGSRNGQACIAMWVALQRKGIDGLRADVVQCIDNAKYLKELLDGSGIKAWLNEFSTTVTFERPPEEVVQRWQLACKKDIAHVVVMPSVHKKKLRQFHLDFIESRGTANDMTVDPSDTTAYTGGG